MSTQFLCRVTPSRWAAGAVFAAHGAAALALLLNPLGAATLSVLMLGLTAHMVWLTRLVVTRQATRAIIGIRCEESSGILIYRRDGTRLVAYPVGPVVVHPWLIAARMQPVGGNRAAQFSLAIPGDACARDAHRELRVGFKVAVLIKEEVL